MNLKGLSEHLEVDQYGDFRLTDAIRPSLDLQVVPCEGYRLGTYRDHYTGIETSVLLASVSREWLFDVFLELLGPLGDIVNVVLETSHDSDGEGHRDIYCEQVDMPVAQSYFCDFEDLLLNDGQTGVAVMANEQRMEVQFDEHKLLAVYAPSLSVFEEILQRNGILRNDAMRLINEGDHLHTTDPRYFDSFDQLCYRLGVGEPAERMSW